MKKMLIVNCDDFGLSKGINEAVLEGFKKSYISSTTIMVNQAYTENALNIWKENSEIMNVGLHFCLDMEKPLSKSWGDYLDENGKFRRPHRESLHLVPEELIEEELRLQIEKAESLGCKLTHIDSHHHVHIVHENVNNVVVKVAREIGLPIRTNENMIPSFYDKGVTRENLAREIENIGDRYMDLMCHISKADEELARKTSYYDMRLKEDEILEEMIVEEYLKEKEVVLGSYRDIKGDHCG